MTDFTSDLNDEKLSEIQSQIQQLASEIVEAKGDIDRLETIEFFDRADGERQIIVHWLKDVDGATIVSVGDAKDAFVQFSETRADEPTEHQVSHGDVLVIGGECPWYGLCAKVDRGIGGGDVGFQEEDPLDVAGTELENAKPYKEFIVWGGCHGEGGGENCPPSTPVSVPALCAGSSSGDSQTIQAISSVDSSEEPPTDYPLFKLKEMSVSPGEGEGEEGDTKFLAFNINTTEADTSCNASSGTCGLFADLKKFSTEKKDHTFNSTVSLFTLTSTPVEATPTTLQLTTNTLTLTPGSSSLNSNSCGQLTVSLGGGDIQDGACAAAITATQVTSSDPEGTPRSINDITITPNGEETVSLGTTKLVADLVEKSLGSSPSEDRQVFLPVIPNTSCPKTETVQYVETVVVGISEDTSECGGSGENLCKTVTISVTPSIGSLNFTCGLLTGATDPTAAAPVLHEFKVPCGCEDENECPNYPGTDTVTANIVSRDNTNQNWINVDVNLTFTWEPCRFVWSSDGNSMVINSNAAGLWSLSGNGFLVNAENKQTGVIQELEINASINGAATHLLTPTSGFLGGSTDDVVDITFS